MAMLHGTPASSPQARVEARAIRVRGLVQGVGLRPLVYRLAHDHGLAGEVWNDAEGVMIRAWGMPPDLDRFLERLRENPPPLGRVDTVEWTPLADAPTDSGFHIVPSRGGKVRTAVVPDAASCQACRDEIADPADRRYHYPFTNCTHCGPRLSIVRSVPYDRSNTSMAAFLLCPACRAEYEDPRDRRFHAQPTACPDCGPRLWLERFDRQQEKPIILADQDPLDAARRQLLAGAIVAVKGLGGFHLACDALDQRAVAELRARKRLYAKPVDLMARDIDVVRRYCAIDGAAEDLLTSAAAPIVILPAVGPDRVAEAVAPGHPMLGFMLPYTPLHHLLLAGLNRPLVMTSANISDEPQCTGNDETRRRLWNIADFGVFHDRAIVNRLDDSVTRVIAGAPRMIRRARGYAPAPLPLPAGFERAPPLLALGGELKSTFCLLKDGQALISEHIGDLEDAATFQDYQKALSLYLSLFDHAPEVLALDMHPEYLSTKMGRELAGDRQISFTEVQHHHAHIASCLAENQIPLDTRPVLGIALDGLGFGPDGTLWGGEFLRVDYFGFERLAHLPPVAMPGGAQAIRQPWRSAYAQLDAAIGWDEVRRARRRLDVVRFLEAKPLAALDAMMRKSLNCPLSTSCGRLFDAVAAILGICREAVTYEGQAAIELECLVDAPALAAAAGYRIDLRTKVLTPFWQALLDDLEHGVPAAVIAVRFHRGFGHAVVNMARLLFETEGDKLEPIVALSGGSFQNKMLLGLVSGALRDLGLTVLTHRQVPANDGGLSLGQAAVAAARSIGRQPDKACA